LNGFGVLVVFYDVFWSIFSLVSCRTDWKCMPHGLEGSDGCFYCREMPRGLEGCEVVVYLNGIGTHPQGCWEILQNYNLKIVRFIKTKRKCQLKSSVFR